MAANNDNKLLINGALMLVGYFAFAKPIFEFLGIAKGAGTKAFENNTTDPQSPFAPNLWRNYYYGAGTKANGRKPITADQLKRLNLAANYFYYAFGVTSDDEDEVIKAIQMCKNKAEVSLLSFLILNTYKGSMLALMKYGKNVMPNNGLNESELQVIFNMVNKMPLI